MPFKQIPLETKATLAACPYCKQEGKQALVVSKESYGPNASTAQIRCNFCGVCGPVLMRISTPTEQHRLLAGEQYEERCMELWNAFCAGKTIEDEMPDAP